jgi:hypothetical protein
MQRPLARRRFPTRQLDAPLAGSHPLRVFLCASAVHRHRCQRASQTRPSSSLSKSWYRQPARVCRQWPAEWRRIANLVKSMGFRHSHIFWTDRDQVSNASRRRLIQSAIAASITERNSPWAFIQISAPLRAADARTDPSRARRGYIATRDLDKIGAAIGNWGTPPDWRSAAGPQKQSGRCHQNDRSVQRGHRARL